MKRRYVLVFILVIGAILTGCGSDKPKDFEFVRDESLDKYIEQNYLIEDLKGNIFEATGAKISYVNDSYIVITNHSGIFLFNIHSKKMVDAIDTKSMGLNLIQGYPHTNIIGYRDYIAIYNDDAEDAYIYSILDNGLMKVDLDAIPEEFIETNSDIEANNSNFSGYADSYTDTYIFKDEFNSKSKLYVLRHVYSTNEISIEVLNPETLETDDIYVILPEDTILELKIGWSLLMDSNFKLVFHKDSINDSTSVDSERQTFNILESEDTIGLSYLNISDMPSADRERLIEIQNNLNISDNEKLNYEKIKYYSILKRNNEVEGINYTDKCYILISDDISPLITTYIIEDLNIIDDDKSS